MCAAPPQVDAVCCLLSPVVCVSLLRAAVHHSAAPARHHAKSPVSRPHIVVLAPRLPGGATTHASQGWGSQAMRLLGLPGSMLLFRLWNRRRDGGQSNKEQPGLHEWAFLIIVSVARSDGVCATREKTLIPPAGG